jgi:site-specific recombinase XerC
MRVSDALAVYLVQLQADGRSAHTIKQATRHVRLFAAWAGDPPIADVGHELVARFLASDAVRLCADGEPREPSSANTIRSSLRAFCAFCHAAGYVASNPARLVRRARTRPPTPKGVSAADAQRLLAELERATTPVERRDRVLFTLMLRTGLRLGSVIGLDVEDLDIEAGELVVRSLKGGGDDTVVVPTDMIGPLAEHIGARRSGPLFRATHGRRLGARHVRRRLEQWAERAGIPATHPHALRHAFALRLYAKTGDVLLTARALCHRSVTSTQIYARPTLSAVRAAIG